MKKDKYQKRYEAHQKRKKSQLISLLDSRTSQRVYNNRDIGIEETNWLLHNMAKVPSSCNRQAIRAMLIIGRTEKEFLSGILVGGVGWIHRAKLIILLFAEMDAYKAEGEKEYMPYIDAGVVVANAYLVCEDMKLGCCYVNPNIRTINLPIFNERFAQGRKFVGALALGYYDKKAKKSPKKKSITIK